MGVVESHEGSFSLRLRLCLPEHGTHSAQGQRAASEARFRAMRAEVATMNSPWWLLRLCNLSTIQREWLALHQASAAAANHDIRSAPSRRVWQSDLPLTSQLLSLFPGYLAAAQAQNLPFRDVILAAEDRASRLRTTWRIPGPLAAQLRESYNASQARFGPPSLLVREDGGVGRDGAEPCPAGARGARLAEGAP